MKTIKNTIQLFGLSMSVILCSHAILASAAIAHVTVNNSPTGFVPQITTINVGDTVIWTWPVGSVLHNVTYTGTSTNWPGNSATMSATSVPLTFTNTFNTAGDFPYDCSIHLFTGTINVTAPPASIEISSPRFLSPSDFQFTYSASPNSSYIVQKSSDLTQWTNVSTNLAASSSVLFDDPNATESSVFYRVQLAPNP
ncbi:MAG TPA: hypothetical protein VHG71_08315 [Verrucomicrobiae bacterium]|nr:hypothetical protein [Verrucomicrobiae bacterium]